MPLYEYECAACGARFELIRKFSDPPLEVCPTCGKGPIQKLVSSPAFQFKGSGFYATDYARKSGGDDATAGKAASTAADTTKSSSSDSPASKESSGGDKKETSGGDKPVTTPSSSKDS